MFRGSEGLIPIEMDSEGRAGAPRRPLWELALLGVMLLYFGYVYRGTMFLTEGVNKERDGFYHARYSQMVPERGLSREFRWMQFTSWRDEFCDKDFLYHVFLAPFCSDAKEPLPGAKYATVLLLLAALGALYFVLRAWRAPFALVWVALLAVGSADFLDRMMMVRSHCLSVVLMIVCTHVILKRRWWPCCALAFIYAWSYSSPIAMLIAACAIEFGRFLIERDWRAAVRMPAATFLGLIAGLAIHPYTPHSLTSMWMFFHIIWSGQTGSPVELGSEFRHLTLDSAFTVSIGTTAATLFACIGAVILFFSRKDAKEQRTQSGGGLSSETAGVVMLAAAWFVSIFVSFQRFIEYAAPLGCLAGGLVLRDLLADLPPLAQLKEMRRTAVLAACGAAVMVLTALHAYTAHEVALVELAQLQKYAKKDEPRDESIKRWYRGRFFDGAAEFMRKNFAPQSLVVNFHWDDFPELYYAAPEMNYLVGLDPTFMRLKYPEKAEALEAMRTKKAPFSFQKLREMFGADYVIFVKRRAAMYDELKTDQARARILFSDDGAVIYSLK